MNLNRLMLVGNICVLVKYEFIETKQTPQIEWILTTQTQKVFPYLNWKAFVFEFRNATQQQTKAVLDIVRYIKCEMWE